MGAGYPIAILQCIMAAMSPLGLTMARRLLSWNVPVGVATGLMVTLPGRRLNGVLAVAQYRYVPTALLLISPTLTLLGWANMAAAALLLVWRMLI